MKKSTVGLPEAFLEKLRQLNPEGSEALIGAFQNPRPTTFRINTLKITTEEFLRRSKELSVELDPVRAIPHAFILKQPELRQFTSLPLYSEGLCYVQNLSSMIPPLVLDPQPSEIIVDVAAAPGSKTTQMAALMNNSGKIIANDSSHIRIYRLEANIKMQGVTNVTVRRGLGQLLWQDFPEYFNKALVDAPCSMEGRFLIDDPKTYEHWSPGKVKELSHTQRFLLRSALSTVKPGGTVVYSTCTISPEENEGVIAWLMEKEPNAFSIEQIELSDEIPTQPGVTQWKERIYPEEMKKTVRILPNELYEGFFVAKLRKKS